MDSKIATLLFSLSINCYCSSLQLTDLNTLLESFENTMITIYLSEDFDGPNIKLEGFKTPLSIIRDPGKLLPFQYKGSITRFSVRRRKSHFSRVYLYMWATNDFEFPYVIQSYHEGVKYYQEENPVTFILLTTKKILPILLTSSEQWLPKSALTFTLISVFVLVLDFKSPLHIVNIDRQGYYVCENCFGNVEPKWIGMEIDDLKSLRSLTVDILKRGFDNGYGLIWSVMDEQIIETSKSRIEALKILAELAEREIRISPFAQLDPYPMNMDAIVLSHLFNLTSAGLANVIGDDWTVYARCPKRTDCLCCYAMGIVKGTSHQMFQYGGNKLNSHQQMIMVETLSYSFITCDGVELWNPGNAFLQPFDWHTWIGLIASLVLISISLSLSLSRRDFGSSQGIFAVVRIVLEQPKERENNTQGKFRVIKITVLFMFILINNAYKGQILSFLHRLPNYEMKWVKIEDLRNFTLYSTEEHNFFASNYSMKALKEGHDRKQKKNVWAFSGQFAQLYNAFVNLAQLAGNFELMDKLETNTISRYSWSKKMKNLGLKHVRFNVTGFDILKDCNKSAYAVANKKVDVELLYGNILLSQQEGMAGKGIFMKGDDEFMSDSVFWRIDPHFDSLIAKRIEKMMESGIHQLWEAWMSFKFIAEQRKFLKTKNGRETNSLKLDANIISLFAVLSLGLLMGCLSLVLEKFRRK